MIINITKSPVKHKRFRAYLDTGKNYDFGLDTGSTYIDHHDKQIRDAYRARHIQNKTEKQLIENLVPSPALFSYALLWGPYTDLRENVNYLNHLWGQRYHH